MTTKERVEAKLNSLDEGEMNLLLKIIEQMTQKEASPVPPQRLGLLAKLRQIKIEAPEDFAANLDAYTSGEKHDGNAPDIH